MRPHLHEGEARGEPPPMAFPLAALRAARQLEHSVAKICFGLWQLPKKNICNTVIQIGQAISPSYSASFKIIFAMSLFEFRLLDTYAAKTHEIQTPLHV